jgi:hypothetical protein
MAGPSGPSKSTTQTTAEAAELPAADWLKTFDVKQASSTRASALNFSHLPTLMFLPASPAV